MVGPLYRVVSTLWVQIVSMRKKSFPVVMLPYINGTSIESLSAKTDVMEATSLQDYKDIVLGVSLH